MLKSIFISVLSLIFLTAVFTGASVIWMKGEFDAPGPLNAKKTIEVERGDTLKEIARKLEQENVISHSWVFEINARFNGKAKSIQAGEYGFRPDISMNEILQKLQKGDVVYHQITIPEGLTNYQIRQILKAEPLLKGDIETMPPEGFLLPETYSFRKGLPRQDLIDRMHAAKKDFLDQAWKNKKQDLPVKSPEEAVILASIVEKETGVADERAKVAGVFINRLKTGMRLQSDPTVIYALTAGVPEQEGKGPLGRRLLRKDLKFDSPYNTYVYSGLPPGPIANPGRESIRAVLMPEDHKYFYFVADGTGGHFFSKTLKQHNINVQKWRRIRDGLD